jgi:ribosome-associated protein
MPAECSLLLWLRMPDDDERSARQIRSRQRRDAGEDSARLARALMNLSAAAVKKIVLDEDLQQSVLRAQAITSQNARRRAERTLAGDLRRHDTDELEDRLKKVQETGNADTELFHQAERWRDRLIAEDAALAEFPGRTDDELPRLIDAARRERDVGKPPGAGRKLFRYVVEALRTPPADETPQEDHDDET